MSEHKKKDSPVEQTQTPPPSHEADMSLEQKQKVVGLVLAAVDGKRIECTQEEALNALRIEEAVYRSWLYDPLIVSIAPTDQELFVLDNMISARRMLNIDMITTPHQTPLMPTDIPLDQAIWSGKHEPAQPLSYSPSVSYSPMHDIPQHIPPHLTSRLPIETTQAFHPVQISRLCVWDFLLYNDPFVLKPVESAFMESHHGDTERCNMTCPGKMLDGTQAYIAEMGYSLFLRQADPRPAGSPDIPTILHLFRASTKFELVRNDVRGAEEHAMTMNEQPLPESWHAEQMTEPEPESVFLPQIVLDAKDPDSPYGVLEGVVVMDQSPVITNSFWVSMFNTGPDIREEIHKNTGVMAFLVIFLKGLKSRVLMNG